MRNMRYLSKLLVFGIIWGCFTTESVGEYTSPIPLAAVDTLKAHIKIRLQEPARDTLPTMNLHQIIQDIISNGMAYFEQNYPQEVVNIVKPAYKSFRHLKPYGKFVDEQEKTYYTIGRQHADRFYEDSIFEYGKVWSPVLVHSPNGASGDRYIVPLAYKDTMRFCIEFAPDSTEYTGKPWKCTSMGYTGRNPANPLSNLTHFPPMDSVEADSIMRSTLPPGEEIVSQRLFNMAFTAIPYWNFLTQTGSKSAPDKSIYWIDPVNKEVH